MKSEKLSWYEICTIPPLARRQELAFQKLARISCHLRVGQGLMPNHIDSLPNAQYQIHNHMPQRPPLRIQSTQIKASFTWLVCIKRPTFQKNVEHCFCHQNLFVTYPSKTIYHANFEVHLKSSTGSAFTLKFAKFPEPPSLWPKRQNCRTELIVRSFGSS